MLELYYENNVIISMCNQFDFEISQAKELHKQFDHELIFCCIQIQSPRFVSRSYHQHEFLRLQSLLIKTRIKFHIRHANGPENEPHTNK